MVFTKPSTIFKEMVLGRKSRGFTLIEMLIAISISIVVAMILLVVSTNGLKYVREIQQKQRLQAEADYLINKLAYWIRQSKGLPLPGGPLTEFTITLPDNSVKTFKQSGDQIFLDTAALTGNNIQSAEFYIKDRAVKINIQFKDNFSVKTTLAQRNQYGI
jgi:prepilin-type N-terminal cleavage/methylation domain-containing protein